MWRPGSPARARPARGLRWLPWLSAVLLAACAPAGHALKTRYSEEWSATSLSSGNSSQPRPPRVYFLFLAVDKVSNLDVWQAFFANASPDLYRAYVHCKLPQCVQMVTGSPLVAVPTVPSYYCTDLVSPMNQMLAYALKDNQGMANAADKFVFVSDSTLPAKPFSYIYSTYAGRQGSDFCVFPSNEWADVPSPGGGHEIAVKHHQWITLHRAHAEKAWTLWSSGTLHNFMSHFRMNLETMQWSNNTFADSRNWGCLDEFWYMAALYGTLHQIDSSLDQDVQLSAFTSAPLRISHGAGWQGQCDTFVVWSKYLHTAGYNPFSQMHATLDPVSIPHGGNMARPGWWDTISTVGLRSIRQSSFLFVRKFIDKPTLQDGPSFAASFSQIVMS